MKTIATITCHDVYNHGAALQAYALQCYCKSLGYDYTIIDYKPDYLSGHFDFTRINNPKFDKPIIKQLYLLAKLPERLKALPKKKKFDKFKSQYLNISNFRYTNNEDLKNNVYKADIYIAGSDQIWNTLLKNGNDSSFYLDFVGNRGRKISYAASFATDEIHNNAEDFVKKELKNFDAISVRETSGQQLLSRLGFSGEVVLDPVFLINPVQWDSMIENKNLKKCEYILVYDFDRSEEIESIALELQQEFKFKIFSISPSKLKYADKNFVNIGPLQFLWLIKNASYVISNSFHATAFSIIFEKEFYVVNRKVHINTRMRDFLSQLSLSDRIICHINDMELGNINYKVVLPKLQFLIEQSKNFLKNQLFYHG